MPLIDHKPYKYGLGLGVDGRDLLIIVIGRVISEHLKIGQKLRSRRSNFTEVKEVEI